MIHHVLGLTLFRQQRSEAAVNELRLAAQLDSRNTRYVYVYAVALNSTGDPQRAIMILQGANAAHPDNIQILQALVSFHRDLGNQAAAKKYAGKLQAISP